jgi:DNA polymerase-3 subunit beta
MVATDGHRLAYARRTATLKGADGQRVLVPRKAIVELGRLLEGEEAVAFQQVENHLLFVAGGRTLASKMIEGQFPAFEKVVGVTGDHVAKLGRDALTQGLRRVSLLSSERSRAVRLQLAAGKLEIFASSPELGEAREALAADYAGEALEIGFNAQYILDFLGAAGSPDVSLELKDSESQGVFRPAGEQETDYRYVVMPMRL